VETPSEVLVHDMLVVEGLEYIRVSERVVALELIVMCSANTGDVVGFID